MYFPIVVCGTITIDSVFKHEKNITAYFQNISNDVGINFVARTHQKYFGGTASNVAYNLSLFNIGCRLIASVGSDFYEFKSFLNKHSIDTDWVAELINELTSTCVIFCDNDNNHLDIFYPGPMYNDSNLSLHDKNIEGLMLAIITPTDVQSMVIRSKECHCLNIPYIFDPGLFIENFDVEELISCCNNAKILTMNEKEFSRLAKHTGLCSDDALKLNSTIVITKGKGGSTLYCNGESIDIPAIKTSHIFDTIGAGDAYKAGLALGIINHLPMADCCKIGSTIASFNIEFHGSTNHTFTREAFVERYNKHFNKHSNIDIESILETSTSTG